MSTFAWSERTRRQEWLEILQTHSDHQALPAEQRERLLQAVGEAVDSVGGTFECPTRRSSSARGGADLRLATSPLLPSRFLLSLAARSEQRSAI